ncbi:type 1 glutamine amidotransferase [Filimonas lacunae]|nr:GMP synthase [Filimonas lacunae]
MQIKIAILDLYNGQPNEGMRCLQEIVTNWAQQQQHALVLNIFEVRQQVQLPDLSYDIYISSGGPGSPLSGADSKWENAWINWLQKLEAWNNTSGNKPKPVFFICHSFQLACKYYKVGQVCKRHSAAFGAFPVHQLQAGKQETLFQGLHDPFYAVDSRNYQVVQPDLNRIQEIGGQLLAIEKERPHVPYERAIMAIRFNKYFIGTQFHPEADAEGTSKHLQREDKKAAIIESYGEEKWHSMMEAMINPEKINHTQQHILPAFLNNALL